MRYSSRSYYVFPKDSGVNQGLYFINIQISDDEGFIFIIRDLIEEPKGRFFGYKYKGRENGSKVWLTYENPKLAQVLKELRSR